MELTDLLHQEIADLKNHWNLLSEKLSRLQRDHILETRSEVKLRLEYQIKDAKAERQQIARQLAELEARCSQTSRPEPQIVETGNHDQIPAQAVGINPFGDRGRITDVARFFDRQDLLRQIFEELHKGVNISLVGESAVGKSSLLAMVCKQGPAHFPDTAFVYLNMEWIEHEGDFYDALCDELDIPGCRGYKLTRALRGTRSILCLDEIEKMAWESFTVNVRSHLRGLADGASAPLKLIIVSRSPLAHLFPDSPELDSPLAGICRQIDVPPFSTEIARQFLHQRLQATGIVFTEQHISDLLIKTGGHPARLQDEAATLYRELRAMKC